MYIKARRKGKHLTENERNSIAYLCKLGRTQTEIAETLQISQATVSRELKRGEVEQLNGATWEYYKVYSPQKAQMHADYMKANHGPELKIGSNRHYLQALEKHILTGSSPRDAIEKEKRNHDITISKTTFYRYLSMRLFEHISYKQLPQGHPKTGKQRVSHSNVSHPDHRSIEQRSKEISSRNEVGHWELDSVIGKSKGKKESCLVLTERKTRIEIVLKVENKTAQETVKALACLRRKFGKDWHTFFKTISCDNGTEFSDQLGMERVTGVMFFYCHPQSPHERGTNEVTNKLVRRQLPKGQSMRKVDQHKATQVQHWVNHYTRPLFGGKSAADVMANEIQSFTLSNPDKIKRFFDIN